MCVKGHKAGRFRDETAPPPPLFSLASIKICMIHNFGLGFPY